MSSQRGGGWIPGSYLWNKGWGLFYPPKPDDHTTCAPTEGVNDIYIAVMGITGSGKSSFIQLCTGLETGIGNDLKSETKDPNEFTFMYSENLRVTLIDTPGFDDTTRTDTDVLRGIAGWLGVSYKASKRLSGLIYLHRISDPIMQGSAKRNLFMFQKLCGQECFSQIVLVTTMWAHVSEAIGARREQELIREHDFWGLMIKRGSQTMRHRDQHDRSSALAILGTIIRNRRELKLRIQDEMTCKGLELEQTEAGQQVDSDTLELQKKHRAEIEELQRDKEEALAAKNVEAVQQIQQLQADLTRRIQAGEESRKRLHVDLERLQAEREAEMTTLLEQLQEQKKNAATKQEEYDRFMASNRSNTIEWQNKMRAIEESREKDREEFERQLEAIAKKKSGVKTDVVPEVRKTIEDLAKMGMVAAGVVGVLTGNPVLAAFLM